MPWRICHRPVYYHPDGHSQYDRRVSLNYLFVGLLRFRHLGWKAALGILTAIVLLIAACYKPMIKPRIDASMAELTRYEQAEGIKAVR